MLSKTPVIVIIVFVVLFLSGSIFGICKLASHYPHFYDRNGKELPYHAVDSLVRAEYTPVRKPMSDTILAYFPDHVFVDLPEEYRLLKATDNVRAPYDSATHTIFIGFDNPENK